MVDEVCGDPVHQIVADKGLLNENEASWAEYHLTFDVKPKTTKGVISG